MEDTEFEDEAWDDEDEDCVTVTQEEYLAELYGRGIDAREWDPNFYCLRRASTSTYNPSPAIYVRRETLLEPIRIERLRWRAYLNYAKNIEVRAGLKDEMKKLPDAECFVPHDEEEFQKSVEESAARGEPLTEAQIERYSHPRRVHVEADYSDDWVRYDDDFWTYEEPEHDKEVAMEVIAAAGCLGEWEQVTLPARIERAKDPAKLALGARWQHASHREIRLQDRCFLFNQLLAASILNSDVLPEGPRLVQKLIRVRLNDRIYYFNVGRHSKSANFDLWPVPSDYDEVVIDGRVKPAGTVR